MVPWSFQTTVCLHVRKLTLYGYVYARADHVILLIAFYTILADQKIQRSAIG